MNRRHFFKLAAALPVVGPAVLKAAARPTQDELINRMVALMGALPDVPLMPTKIYMSRGVYREFLRAKICRQAYLDQFKILGIAPPEDA